MKIRKLKARSPFVVLTPASVCACALLTLAVLACEPRGADVPAEVREARQDAARNACVATELVQRAEDNLETLAAFAGVEEATGSPAAAAVEFARAYLHHAELRHAAISHADSALNHSRVPADSVRHMQAADRFVPRTPQPGTLEANVFEAWVRDFNTIRADEDHRCNWDV